MNIKSLTCSTSGKHADAGLLSCVKTPHGRVMGTAFYAKITQPIFDATVRCYINFKNYLFHRDHIVNTI